MMLLRPTQGGGNRAQATVQTRMPNHDHHVRLMQPSYVKGYVKRGKTDAADAEAICEAVSRPSMRFVPVKSEDTQALLMTHKAREFLVRQQTQIVNATGSGVWADAAHRSEEMEAKLKAAKLTSHIHRKGKRGKSLTEQAKGSNRTKSAVRVRVEHIFGAQANDMGGTLVRTIGMLCAKAKIGMKNLAYNMRRLVQLRRLNPCPA
jgi:transposase